MEAESNEIRLQERHILSRTSVERKEEQNLFLKK